MHVAPQYLFRMKIFVQLMKNKRENSESAVAFRRSVGDAYISRTTNLTFRFIIHYENTPIQIYTENFTSKNWKFSDKKLYIFHISAQNIDCGYSLELPRRGSPNEYPQSMFLSRNKKNKVYPCKPQFYYIKVGFKGVKII